MATPITGLLNFPTAQQVPDKAILDAFNKQTYLGNQWCYATNLQTISGTNEFPLILLTCPTTSTKSLFSNQRNAECLTANSTAIFRYYLNPTVSSVGTTETPVNLRPASSNTALGLPTLNPSVSANGSYFTMLDISTFVPAISNSLVILDPGQTLLVTVKVSAGSTVVNSEILWFEI
jgi:hypothetical protein